MSIHEDISFDNQGEPIHTSLFRTLFLSLLILHIAGLGFGVGRLTVGQGSPGVQIKSDPSIIQALASTTTTASSTIRSDKSTQIIPGQATSTSQAASVYASSKGKRYYYMNCHSTVSAANKITFASPILAEKAGYTLAANCHE